MSTLLDTNVISELVRGEPNEGVLAFVSSLRVAWIPVIVIHELDFGIAKLPPGRKRGVLESKITNVLNLYSDRIIPLSRAEAREAAVLRVEARRSGRVLHLPDALIAATAKEHGLTLATRNISDFNYLGIDVFDPWTG